MIAHVEIINGPSIRFEMMSYNVGGERFSVMFRMVEMWRTNGVWNGDDTYYPPHRIERIRFEPTEAS